MFETEVSLRLTEASLVVIKQSGVVAIGTDQSPAEQNPKRVPDIK